MPTRSSGQARTRLLKAVVIWAGVLSIAIVPLVVAGFSPLLEWRQPVYIVAGFAGVACLSLLFVQPLLAGGHLPGIHAIHSRRWHRGLGVLLILAVLVHVAGLWVTSPPDVIDALLLRSPTPFSIWGVVAMWAVFATGCMVVFRRRLPLRVTAWRRLHHALTAIVVVATVVHAWLIQGTMESVSKSVLSAFAVAAFLIVVILRWRMPQRLQRPASTSSQVRAEP